MNLAIRDGAFTYWTLGPETHPDELAKGMEQLGFEGLTPEPRSWQMALKAAMMRHYDKAEQLVRPLKSRVANGYTVVAEHKDVEENTFSTEVSLKVDAEGELAVTHGEVSWEDREKLQRLVYHFRKMLPGSAVSEMLITIAKERLRGVNLKDRGGLYFIPGDGIDVMEAVRGVVERSSVGEVPNSVSVVPIRLNGSTLRDLKVNITKEVSTEMAGILADLAENQCGERAIEHRMEKCNQTIVRMKEYEALLGETLEECRTALRRSLDGLSAAQAVKDAEIFDLATV